MKNRCFSPPGQMAAKSSDVADVISIQGAGVGSSRLGRDVDKSSPSALYI